MSQPATRCLLALAGFVFPAACARQITAEPKPAIHSGITELYQDGGGRQTRWAGFENPTAAKGAGGKANSGWKGHAAEALKAGETKILLNVSGCGTVRRIWMTFHPREPRLIRSLLLRMYWDGSARPAVSVPLGDFFGHILGRMAPFENELFSSPEGRSFNCFVPMPFSTGAKITLSNDSNEDVPYLFCDIDFELQPWPHEKGTLYFHAYWHRERYTTLGRDFEILPTIHGRGRYLGAHVGIITHPDYTGWWGEGEVKIYLDGDQDYPTLNNSGTEDYVGTAWGQGIFQHRYQGALLGDSQLGHYTFYRYHIPDPVYFAKDCRVTIQQMGNDTKEAVLKMIEKGTPIKPVLVDHGGAEKFLPLLDGKHPPDLAQDSTVNNLPEITSVQKRTEAIPEKNPPPSK